MRLPKEKRAKKTLGVIGGGQLARMLGMSCNINDVDLIVLDPDKTCPAASIASEVIEGNVHDLKSIQEVARKADVVTTEIENIGVIHLAELSQQGKNIFPHPEAIRTIQNKFLQKKHLSDYGIAVPPFELSSSHDWKNVHRFGIPCVQKHCTGGYDGRSVHIIRSESNWENRLSGKSFIERFIPCFMEIAVMVVKGRRGQLVAYDPVEMVMDESGHVLDKLIAPARISTDERDAATELAVETAESFSTPGIFGVEMFLDADKFLWVNEVAPRTHNSGHHTIEACDTSQFENQIRMLFDLELGSSRLLKNAVTVNLIGNEGECGNTDISGLTKSLQQFDIHLHLYGKKECRPGRKMGHITCLNEQLDIAINRSLVIQETIRSKGLIGLQNFSLK